LAKIVQRRTGLAHRYSAGRFLLKRPAQQGAPDTFLDFFANTLVLIAERIAA